MSACLSICLYDDNLEVIYVTYTNCVIAMRVRQTCAVVSEPETNNNNDVPVCEMNDEDASMNVRLFLTPLFEIIDGSGPHAALSDVGTERCRVNRPLCAVYNLHRDGPRDLLMMQTSARCIGIAFLSTAVSICSLICCRLATFFPTKLTTFITQITSAEWSQYIH